LVNPLIQFHGDSVTILGIKMDANIDCRWF
jgi:hypothetical protein